MINKPALGQRIAVGRSQPVSRGRESKGGMTLMCDYYSLERDSCWFAVDDMRTGRVCNQGRGRWAGLKALWGALPVADRPNRRQNTRLRHPAGFWVE